MSDIPIVPRDYLDVEKCNRAVANILEVVKPGDVINTEAQLQNWYQFAMIVGWTYIQKAQKIEFGEDRRWKDEHTTLFINEDKIHSVELPLAKFLNLRDFCLDKITIYRYRFYEFSKEDIKEMDGYFNMIWHTKYDYGQLIDILIGDLFPDNPNAQRIHFFDLGKRRKVCSVGVRYVYEKWIEWHNKQVTEEEKKLDELFRRLNPLYSDVGCIKERYFTNWNNDPDFRAGVDVEKTSPAHFANSEVFSGEFYPVATFSQGELVQEYPAPDK